MTEFRVAFAASKMSDTLEIIELARTRGAEGESWRYFELADRPAGTSVFIFKNEIDAMIVRSRAKHHPRIELLS